MDKPGRPTSVRVSGISRDDLPLDIRPQWLKVIRRLQSVACKQGGYALVRITVLVNEGGDPAFFGPEPLFWTEPEIIRLEPKAVDVLEVLRQIAMSRR